MNKTNVGLQIADEEVLLRENKLCLNAFSDYKNKEVVAQFFKIFDSRKKHSFEYKSKYLQLKYFHSEQPWKYLTQLGDLYLEVNKLSLAFMCFVESLRLNTNQPKTFKTALSLQKKSKPTIPLKLKPNICTVSVIVPTMGRSEELKECINSVLKQTFTDFEIIIVNDGGSDSVEDIVSSFATDKIKYFKLKKNGGIAQATNYGIINANGKYLAYLDDDDVYYSRHLELLINTIKESGCKIAYSNVQEVSGKVINGIFQRNKVTRVRDVEFDRDLLLQKVYLTPCESLHERNILKETGLLNEDLPMSSDWEFWLRLCRKFDFKHLSEFTTEWRKKQDNYTKRDALAARFFGNLVCRYHEFCQGKIILVTMLKKIGNQNQAQQFYDEIISEYTKQPKSVENIESMLELGFLFNDHKFIRRLSKDYFQMDKRKCLKKIIENKSLAMFFGITFKLPKLIINSVFGRVKGMIWNRSLIVVGILLKIDPAIYSAEFVQF